MKKTIEILKINGFLYISSDERTEKFLMRKGRVCIYHLGGGCYEVFKNAYADICYSKLVRNLDHPALILKTVIEIDEL